MSVGENPLITVITLSYYSKFLMETIDSVLGQTYENIQYIISDDGTKDFNKEYVQNYIKLRKKNNIKEVLVMKQAENLGTVKNINCALRLATGEYIFHLSGDDMFFNNDILSQWVAQFQITKSEIMTAYQARYDNQLDKLLSIIPSKREAKKIKNKNPSDLYRDLLNGNYILGSVTARSKGSYEKFGYYDEDYTLLEDYPMILYLLRQNEKIQFWDQIAIKYRDGGISNAENHSDIYERDCNLILEKEIKNYASDKKISAWRYLSWKKRQKKMGEFIQKYSTRKNIIERILLYFCYPKRGIEKIVSVILQRGKK